MDDWALQTKTDLISVKNHCRVIQTKKMALTAGISVKMSTSSVAQEVKQSHTNQSVV